MSGLRVVSAAFIIRAAYVFWAASIQPGHRRRWLRPLGLARVIFYASCRRLLRLNMDFFRVHGAGAYSVPAACHCFQRFHYEFYVHSLAPSSRFAAGFLRIFRPALRLR